MVILRVVCLLFPWNTELKSKQLSLLGVISYQKMLQKYLFREFLL